MKSVVKVIVVALICLTGYSASAQKAYKIGHINIDSLSTVMPEKLKADTALLAVQKQYEDKLREMQEDLQNRYNKYLTEKPKMTPTLIEITEKELEEADYKIKQFQQLAYEDLQKQQQEKMKPIVEKIKKAVADVAKERGYSYVIDSSAGILLFSTPGDDLMLPVKQKLGIK